MRKLASVKVISEIQPIDGRDKIVLASVDGWKVIVKKDEFRPGDKCVYIEIDSVLPERPEFEFLRKNKFRIRTMKMANVISQGICFGMDILPKDRTYEVNEDVTEILGIKKYEIAEGDRASATRKSKKEHHYPAMLMKFKWFRKLVSKTKRERDGFPSFLSKTDEIRIQNWPDILEEDQKWVATEKIDGQSGTFCLVKRKHKLPIWKNRYEYIVCSRNKRIYKEDNSSYWSVSRRYDLPSKLSAMIEDYDWIAVQGECIGPKIQGNKYSVSEYDLYVFNLITPDGRLDSESARLICQYNGLKFVPIINNCCMLPNTVDEVLELAHGQSLIGNTIREGIVFRSKDGLQSFKAVDPLFLIKYNE